MRILRLTSRSTEAELEQALGEADVLTLHAPLTAATRGLPDRRRLAWLRPSALLVNTARGALIVTPPMAWVSRQARERLVHTLAGHLAALVG